MIACPTTLLLVPLLTAVCTAAPAQVLSRSSLLDFVNTRYQAYFHYNICTFKNASSDQHFGRSTGQEPPAMWNPTGLDCEQWARVCRENRLAGGWLTTKHHGGFCLWDSRYTDYDVASSPVKTDVVRAFVDAFRAAGLKVGLYYSVLDYHHGVENGQVTREEIEFLQAQVRELLTDYGPIDYMNFDGWATWPTVPDFDDIPYAELFSAVKSVQPDGLIVNHCYESNLAHADIPFADAAGRRYPFHPDYLRPTAASDVLQRDWWWDDNEGYGTVRRSVDYVLSQLNSYNSHQSVYVLNLAPNTTGRIPDDAVQRLEEVAKAWNRPPDVPRAGPNWGYQYDVAGNLAFLRPATQSSTAPFVRDKRAYPRAEIAVDGVLEGNGAMEQTSITEPEDRAWWQVDLERACRIDRIEIHPRTDRAEEDRPGLIIRILDDAGTVTWEHHLQSGFQAMLPVDAGGKVGRHIHIERTGPGALCLAEVVVQGEVR